MAQSLKETKIQILTCTRCGLSCNCNSPIPITLGNPRNIRYLVIGEAPGKKEDELGEPFVGPAGQFLRRALRKAGLRGSDGAWMNAVSCYPHDHKTPTLAEISACRNNLYDQLDSVDVKNVLVCGAVALSSLLPKVQLSYAMGGPIDYGNKRLFPIYHPSYILRNNTREIVALWERHLSSFAAMVNGEYVTRDTLQIANCLYCNGQRMMDKVTCIRHEGQLIRDLVRHRSKLPPPVQPSLFGGS